jgi:penicillin-binding protein 2B
MIIILVLGIITANIFVIVVGKTHVKSDTDLNRYINASNVSEAIIAERGRIYESNGTVLADDVVTYDIICYLDESRLGAYVENKAETARMLAPILDMDVNEIYDLLSKDVYQVELGSKGRNISKDQKDQILLEIKNSKADNVTENNKIKNLDNDYNGIDFIESSKRVYPKGVFASYIVGFAQSDENREMIGKMGVEIDYEDYLKGENGYTSYQTDENGYILEGMKEERTEAVNGNNIYMTLDEEIQDSLESAFEKTDEIFDADKIWGAVMEVDTGKVLAWGQYPSFDPNELDIVDYNNYGSQYAYEPGSVMKGFIYAAAIDMGYYDGEEEIASTAFHYDIIDGEIKRVNYDNGLYKAIENYNDEAWDGIITYDEGLIRSSNVATCSLLTEVISPVIYRNYLEKFGFFEKVGTRLSEVSGTINFNWPSEKLSLTYGQGSSVTMLQLLQGYSAIFSDGTMKKPYFVDKVVNSYDGSIVLQNQPIISEQVIKEETAKDLQAKLEAVVSSEYGTARHYQMDNINLIAKTGTSQVAGVGGYDNSKMISSVMIALPAENPKYMFYYAYQADSVYAAHQYNEGEMIVLNAIARKYQLNIDSQDINLDEIIEDEVIQEFKMDNLINHSLSYAEKKLEGTNSNIIVIGEGDNIIDQLPKNGSKFFTYSNVLLLTDYNEFKMPNMYGWTKSEVIDFWTITGKKINIIGSGVCIEQSLQSNTVVTDEDIIEVKLD